MFLTKTFKRIRHIKYKKKENKKNNKKKGGKEMPGRTIEPDIEEAIRETEEELSPKREEQIGQSKGNAKKGMSE